MLYACVFEYQRLFPSPAEFVGGAHPCAALWRSCSPHSSLRCITWCDMQYGAARWDAVWYGAARCGAMRRGAVIHVLCGPLVAWMRRVVRACESACVRHCGTAALWRSCSAHSSLRCNTIRRSAARCDAVWCGVVRCDTVRCGAMRCGAVIRVMLRVIRAVFACVRPLYVTTSRRAKQRHCRRDTNKYRHLV
jgi:hypothetical protein